MANDGISSSVETVQQLGREVRNNIARVIIGKTDVIDLLLVALLSNGHTLIEDVPGMGKTVMAKALARSLGASFQRIQGTPDLLPTDVIGVSYYDQGRHEFVFRHGPVFAQILLVDEINRTTPRTQSALLEAMAERQVTVERDSMTLPSPFLVLATQNPIEQEGTFPLPEAQLDRFLMRIQVGYPSKEEEQEILHRFKVEEPLESLQPIITAEQIKDLQRTIRQIYWQPEVERYLLTIVRATRNHDTIQLGVSPRGALALYRACQAYAALQGRDFVLPDDVKFLAPAVLAHRLITTTRMRMRGKRALELMNEIIQNTAVPVEVIAPPASSK
jgi:MoxR-like ATPase